MATPIATMSQSKQTIVSRTAARRSETLPQYAVPSPPRALTGWRGSTTGQVFHDVALARPEHASHLHPIPGVPRLCHRSRAPTGGLRSRVPRRRNGISGHRRSQQCRWLRRTEHLHLVIRMRCLGHPGATKLRRYAWPASSTRTAPAAAGARPITRAHASGLLHVERRLRASVWQGCERDADGRVRAVHRRHRLLGRQGLPAERLPVTRQVECASR